MPANRFHRRRGRGFQPPLGALMARRAVQALVADSSAPAATYCQAPWRRLPGAAAAALIPTVASRALACRALRLRLRPVAAALFPDLLATRIFPTRQEVFFFAPEPGDLRVSAGPAAGLGRFQQPDIYYGFPDLELRGFKIAHDALGPSMIPISATAPPSADRARAMSAPTLPRRFPALAGRAAHRNAGLPV